MGENAQGQGGELDGLTDDLNRLHLNRPNTGDAQAKRSVSSDAGVGQRGVDKSAYTSGSQSARGGKKLGKKRPKDGGPAVSIEDLFVTLSTVQASGINPPPARVVLTPRSAEACLKNGVNPEILRIRDLDSFWEPGVEPEVQRMRHEAYSQRRHEVMRVCRLERRRLIHAEHKAGLSHSKGAVVTTDQVLQQEAKANATMIEQEERRIEKMQRRQGKELEQLLQWEVKMKEVQEENERRTEQERQQQEKIQRERMRRQKAIAEERRRMELKKKAQEDAEELRRQQAAREMHAKDKAAAEERALKEKIARIEARNREEERQRKAEEHQMQTQRILEEQQHRIKKRMEEMEEQERIRQKKVAKKRMEEKAAMQAKRARIEKRILDNLAMAAEVKPLLWQKYQLQGAMTSPLARGLELAAYLPLK